MLHPFCLLENDAIVIVFFCRFVSLLRFRICAIAAWTSDDLSGRLPYTRFPWMQERAAHHYTASDPSTHDSS